VVGFGAMAQHITPLSGGLQDALDLGLTDRSSLQMLQPRSPAISLTAAMQFSMGTRTGEFALPPFLGLQRCIQCDTYTCTLQHEDRQ
jgi:hypothetical protein